MVHPSVVMEEFKTDKLVMMEIQSMEMVVQADAKFNLETIAMVDLMVDHQMFKEV